MMTTADNVGTEGCVVDYGKLLMAQKLPWHHQMAANLH